MIDCMKLEKLLTKPDIGLLSKYISSWYAKENRKILSQLPYRLPWMPMMKERDFHEYSK